MLAMGTAYTYLNDKKGMNISEPEKSDYWHVYSTDKRSLVPVLGPDSSWWRTYGRFSKNVTEGEYKKAGRELNNLVNPVTGQKASPIVNLIATLGKFGIHEFINGNVALPKTWEGEPLDLSTIQGWTLLLSEQQPIAYQEVFFGEKGYFGEDKTKTELGIPQDAPTNLILLEGIGIPIKDANQLNLVRDQVAHKLYRNDYFDLKNQNRRVETTKIDNHPEVLTVRLDQAIRSGGYREEAARIEAEEYMKKVSLLNELFYTWDHKPREITSGEMFSWRNKVREAESIYRERRRKNREINGATFDEEDRTEPQNWMESVLYDYWEIIDQSVKPDPTTGMDIFYGELFSKLMEEQKEIWDEDQIKYIEAYRDRHIDPPGFKYLTDFESKLKGEDFQKAIREGQKSAIGKGLNLGYVYIYNKHIKKDEKDLLDPRSERPAGIPVEAIGPKVPPTPVPTPTALQEKYRSIFQ